MTMNKTPIIRVQENRFGRKLVVTDLVSYRQKGRSIFSNAAKNI